MSRERLVSLVPLILTVLAVTGFVLHYAGLLEPVEELLLRAITPLQAGVSSIASWFGDLTQTSRDLRDLRQRNEDLEAENARLLLENVRLREVQVEVELLRDLLGFAQSNPAFDTQGAHVVGRVIAQDPSNLVRYITLDIGRRAGVGRNMPVVTARGLVGRVSDVGENWCKVLLITDPSSSVNALAQSTRASGLVEGQVDGSLVMQRIPQSETVSVGDTVFTSGLGGTFPRQILIGQITAVQRKDYDLYQSAVVKPTVDFGHLETVLVVTSFEPMDGDIGDEDGP
jgi:rod shape-determining protein MreC